MQKRAVACTQRVGKLSYFSNSLTVMKDLWQAELERLWRS